jgi:hypothetical protein
MGRGCGRTLSDPLTNVPRSLADGGAAAAIHAGRVLGSAPARRSPRAERARALDPPGDPHARQRHRDAGARAGQPRRELRSSTRTRSTGASRRTRRAWQPRRDERRSRKRASTRARSTRSR